jgi:hypothetical protein
MTAASIAGAHLCHTHLTNKGAGKKLRSRLEESMQAGLDWLEEHWSIQENSMAGEPDKDQKKWRLYWLYALERVGSFLDVTEVAGHAWYAEGAEALLKEQEPSGCWVAGQPAEIDTCFALLFLRQGSRKSAASTPRARAPRAAGEASLVVLTGEGSPRRLWLQVSDDALAQHLRDDGAVEVVEWFVDSEVVARIAPQGDPTRFTFPIEHGFSENRDYSVRAVMHLLDTHRRPAGEFASAEVLLSVDDVFTPADEEALADLGRSVLPIHAVTITTSSTSEWTNPSAVADGLYACQWRAADDDPTPWIRLDFERAVRASSLKLAPAWHVGGAHDHLARPKEVELSLGRGRTVRVTLPDLGRAKHEIPFKKTSIKSLEIRILSTWPGSASPVVGLAEVELFR